MQLLKDFNKELLWCKWDKDLTSFIEHNDYYGSVIMLLSDWYIFSSSEPLGSLVSLWYSHDPSSSSVRRHHPSSTFSKISKTTGPVKAKFHTEPQRDGGTKVLFAGSGSHDQDGRHANIW